MKLELKHLAPYLPYGLNCYGQGEVVEGTEYDENPIPKLLTIIGMDSNWITVDGIRKTVDESIMIEDCIPILRPLSDLTKEIEVNGEKFVPIEWLSKKYICFKIKWIEEDKLFEINGELGSASYLPNFIHRRLIEWHFDVFGLIEKNLAIDINPLDDETRRNY